MTDIKPPLDIQVPSKATLTKYGLDEQMWLQRLRDQGWACAICHKKPSPNKKTGKVRFVVDHYHARNYKKMPPEKKRLYVRGICCWFCNSRYLAQGITVEISGNVHEYLKAFEARKP